MRIPVPVLAVAIVAILGGCLALSRAMGGSTETVVRGEFAPGDCPTQGGDGHGQSCGALLGASIEALGPGETLRLAPGTYDVDRVTMRDVDGERRRPIVIEAADPDDPPVVRGLMSFRDPDHLHLDGLVFEAAVDDQPALSMQCGVGWRVERSEIRGAAETGARSNMVITGDQPGAPNPDGATTCADEPREFLVAHDCFTDPFVDPSLDDHPDPDVRRTRNFFHNLYVSFEGTTRTNGIIERNIFVGNRNGSGVKLGDGEHHGLGARNVTVAHNTFSAGRTALVLHDDVRDTLIFGNLIDDMRGKVSVGDGVAVFPNNLTNTTNEMGDTLAYGVTRIIGEPVRGEPVVDAGDNVIDPGAPGFEDDPLEPTGCDHYLPSSPAAAAYGRYGGPG